MGGSYDCADFEGGGDGGAKLVLQQPTQRPPLILVGRHDTNLPSELHHV